MRVFSLQRQSGSTLIEVMVSIVVMAIGLLGLAGLQVSALKFEKSSSQRSEASLAAYDISERIRANYPGIAAYVFTDDYATSHAAVHTPPHNCSVAPCLIASDVAQNDIQDWLRNIQTRLVGGSGYVVQVAGTTMNTFDVTIMWSEQGLTIADASCPAAVAAPVGVRCFNYRTTP